MGWGGMYHSHEVVQYVVTETFGDPSMSVSGAKKSRLKRNDMYFIHALYTHFYTMAVAEFMLCISWISSPGSPTRIFLLL